MIFRKIVFLCTLALLFFSKTQAQFEVFGSIEGYVYDSLTNEPVIGANVFINNSTIGAATDIEGKYFIERVRPGEFELVFSHVTYDYRTKPIIVESGAFMEVNMALMPNIRELAEVTIEGGSNREWKRSLGFFEKYFLGTSLNANKCEIRNPEVLDFQFDPVTKVTNVIAEDELVIDNEALGYTIYYVLERFEFDNDYKIMLGKSRFEEMEAPDDKTEKKWAKERQRTYEGSIQHFFKALVNDELEKNGFKIYRLDKLPQVPDEPRYVAKPQQLMTFGGLDMKRKVYFPGVLEVIFENESEPLAYRNHVTDTQGDARKVNIQTIESGSSQTSMIQLRGKPLEVDNVGYIYNPTDYIVYGYWAWERMAELMPFDYKPQ